MSVDKITFSKTRNVKSPVRAHDTDAGIDFFIPEDFETTGLCIGESVLIPMGIRCKFPHGYKLQFVEKSGIALKKGLVLGAKLVDSGYSGEIMLNLHKVSGEAISLTAGMKITQATLEKIELPSVEIVDDILMTQLHEESERGNGGFGSTGI